MSDAKDLEIEISTESARVLLEIGVDVGIAAAFAGMSEVEREIANPFRRASTLVTQLELVEADAKANARAHAQATAEHYTDVARAYSEHVTPEEAWPTVCLCPDCTRLPPEVALAQNLYDTAPCFLCGGPRHSHDGPGQDHDFESH